MLVFLERDGGQSRHPPHTRLTALFPGLPRWAGTRKSKPIWILLKHETVSGSGITWNICKSAPRSRQITTPTPHHSVFYRPDALPAAQPTASKHWRQKADPPDQHFQLPQWGSPSTSGGGGLNPRTSPANRTLTVTVCLIQTKLSSISLCCKKHAVKIQ